MAKRAMKGKEIIGFLKAEGFEEVKTPEKLTKWHKKATKQPSCFEKPIKKKVKN